MVVVSSRLQRGAVAAFVAAWFLWFAWDGLLAGFAPDDMMNLHGYWEQGPWRAVYSQFLVGSNAYRPLGALFYLPLFTLFGLDPLPFRAVILALLAANVWLLYRVARVLGASATASVLAAVVICYHGGMADLHYSTAVVYDVLCFFFYWCAFLCYVRYRRERRRWGAGEWAAFLGLYLCALNAKEMAVTLPAVLLAWEWLYGSPRDFRPASAAALLTVVSIAGKIFGADPLMAQEAYRPALTATRFFENSSLFLNQFFYGGAFFTTPRTLLLWAATFWLAWRRPRPVLRFAWLFLLLSPLPIVFLKGRVHACLYLPLAGWAIFLAVAFEDVARGLAGWLEGEPLIGRAGRRALFAALVALALVPLGRLTLREKRRLAPEVAQNGALTAAVIRQFREADPWVAPGSRVLLIDDPFHDWDAKFIGELWFRDRSVSVTLQNKAQLSEQAAAKEMQAVFRFEPGRLVRVR